MTREEYWAGMVMQAILTNNDLRKAVADFAAKKQLSEYQTAAKLTKKYVIALMQEMPGA